MSGLKGATLEGCLALGVIEANERMKIWPRTRVNERDGQAPWTIIPKAVEITFVKTRVLSHWMRSSGSGLWEWFVSHHSSTSHQK